MNASSESQPWHAIPYEQALKRLEARLEGLSDSEAAERRERFGPNVVPDPMRRSMLRVILRQFADPLIYILVFAAAASVALGHWSDAGFILAVILVDTSIGAAQEWNAETSAGALKKTLRIFPTVVRAGRRREIDFAELVPGDVVLLQSGGAIPADIRLMSAHDLRVDESLLTGESAPVSKDAAAVLEAAAPLGDRRNMVHAGTMVVYGRGAGVVCETGARTQLGAIAGLLAGLGGRPPLLLRMERFSNRLAMLTIALVAILALGQLARGDDLADILLFSIALAVSAIPEGLPMSITVALAVASARMAKHNVIVRRLPAVEALGSCTLIASDKTGTLTANRLTVKRLLSPDGTEFDVEGEGLELEGAVRPLHGRDRSLEQAAALARAAALTNEAELVREDGAIEARGDAVDIAFLVLAAKLSVDREGLAQACELLASRPYEPKHSFSAALHRCDGESVVSVKGAPETVLPMCGDLDRAGADAVVHRLASQGYRVLAVAQGAGGEDSVLDAASLGGLRLLGFAGLIDPLRSEAPQAMAAARAAGVDVRMITGDHPETALAIARQLDLGPKGTQVLTGARLATLQGNTLSEAVAAAGVYARVEPAQKNLIISELQRQGHFVAVTGDGVNDAPALKTAHVGVAMGAGGTDVARAAADLIITDDNFASIVAGVAEGRVAYDNIRKIVWFLLSTAVAEVMLFALTLLTGLPMPLTAVQILWLNLVHEGIQDVALGLERGEPDVMRRRPRNPREPIFDRQMVEQCFIVGAWVGIVAFGFFAVLHRALGYDVFGARNLTLLFMVSYSNMHVLNCRSETRSVFRIPWNANPWLIAGAAGAQAVHITAMHLPFLNDVLGISPVRIEEWLGVLGLAASVILVAEAYKALRARPLGMRKATEAAAAPG